VRYSTNQVSGHNYNNPFLISHHLYFNDTLRLLIHPDPLAESHSRDPNHGLPVSHQGDGIPLTAGNRFIDKPGLQFFCPGFFIY